MIANKAVSDDKAVDDEKSAQPWCCLCGQNHAFATPCDPERIKELRRQAEVVRRLAVQQRRSAT